MGHSDICLGQGKIGGKPSCGKLLRSIANIINLPLKPNLDCGCEQPVCSAMLFIRPMLLCPEEIGALKYRGCVDCCEVSVSSE